MPRPISLSFRAALESPNNDDPPIVFLRITHATLGDPLRICGDLTDFVLDGDTYIGFPFVFQILSDTDTAPVAKLGIQNVDDRIGRALRSISTPLGIEMEIYAASDWDLTVRPRVPLGTPALQYRATNLELRQVRVDASAVSGTLMSRSYIDEPWPSLKALPSVLPGVHRGG